MIKPTKQIGIFFAVIFLALTATFSSVIASDSLHFFYQRSIYLENLNNPGGWWANPALMGDITKKTASTNNVTPIGNRYTFVSAKYQRPVGSAYSVGFGIMATGISPDQSTQITDQGLSYKSHFSFSNPSFQVAIASRNSAWGNVGFLGDIGGEEISDASFDTPNLYLITRTGIGYLSPYFFNTISLSFTAMTTWHFWQEVYLDENGKAGIRFKILDDFILGNLEYAFSFKSQSSGSDMSTDRQYQVCKGLLSFRIYKIAGILAGFSTDFGWILGNTVNLGLEIRPSNVFPYFGGYEIGVGNYLGISVMHRIWVGYQVPDISK